MAYAALFSISQTLEQIMRPDEQFGQVLQEEQQIISSLHGHVSSLLSFLEDSSQEDNETTRYLERRIRDAAYEAEDVIESHVLNLKKKFGHENLKQIHKDLHMVKEKLALISEEVTVNKKIADMPPGISLLDTFFQPGFTSSNKSTAMVGFGDDLLRIKDQLTGSSSKLEIISILGMGGMGKTTLAENIYNDPLIVYHFDTRAWATVSQQHQVQKILYSLLSSTRPGLRQGSLSGDTEELKQQLYQSLCGKRYLILLDDVWETKVWEEVKRLFPNDNNGSRIILTTRLSDVAKYGCIHHMSFLNLEESWILLQAKVFGDEHCPPTFEEIGKEIIESCKGLPLAIVVIGGLLHKAEMSIEYWKYVSRRVNSTIMETTDDHIMQILSLSYNNLPYCLRACFLYMGAFPEDHKIQKSKLTKLWVAEGFLKPVPGKTLEEVAEECLEELVGRNLILVHKRKYNGKIKSCRIHDLMRKLCHMKGREENFLLVVDQSANFFNVRKDTYHHRHVSFTSYIWDYKTPIFCSQLHSLFYFYVGLSGIRRLFVTLSQNCGLLKVLDAATIRFSGFPIEILELVNLRYITLTYNKKCEFPASISKLSYLQTFILFQDYPYRWTSTVNLPPGIWMMPRLRHLCFPNFSLPYPSGDIIALESLQTLYVVENFICGKEVVQLLPNLKKLGIVYIHDEQTDWSSYCFDNFVHLCQLEILECAFLAKYCPAAQANISLPANIRKLSLSYCKVSREYMRLIGSMLKLEVLNLDGLKFEGAVWEPNEGEFRHLKQLFLDGTNLEHWRADETHFPSLVHLTFRYCLRLVEIPSGIGEIPTLQLIQLYACSATVVNSAKSIKEEQQNMGNDFLQVRIYYLDNADVDDSDSSGLFFEGKILKGNKFSEHVSEYRVDRILNDSQPRRNSRKNRRRNRRA